MSGQMATPYMNFEAREQGLRKAALRSEAVATGNRLAAATEAALTASRLFFDLLAAGTHSDEVVGDAMKAALARLDEQRRAAEAHRAIERQAGW
jgi:hypothetical protein